MIDSDKRNRNDKKRSCVCFGIGRPNKTHKDAINLIAMIIFVSLHMLESALVNVALDELASSFTDT